MSKCINSVKNTAVPKRKLRDNVYMETSAGQVIRAFKAPTQPNTALQQAARANFAHAMDYARQLVTAARTLRLKKKGANNYMAPIVRALYDGGTINPSTGVLTFNRCAIGGGGISCNADVYSNILVEYTEVDDSGTLSLSGTIDTTLEGNKGLVGCVPVLVGISKTYDPSVAAAPTVVMGTTALTSGASVTPALPANSQATGFDSSDMAFTLFFLNKTTGKCTKGFTVLEVGA